GKLEDVFDIQETISRKIVDALKMRLSPQEERRLAERPISNVHAYDCYLRAQREIYEFTEEGLDRALSLIRTGLNVAGDNELLYAAMGHVYWQYINAAIKSDESYLDKAEECARKVAELNPGSAAGYFLTGLVEYARGRQIPGIRNIKRAAALEPNNPFPVTELWRTHAVAGRLAEARSFSARVHALDPLSRIHQANLPVTELVAGDMRKARDLMAQCFQAIPDFAFTRLGYAHILIYCDQLDEARALLETMPPERKPSITGDICTFLKHALAGR